MKWLHLARVAPLFLVLLAPPALPQSGIERGTVQRGVAGRSVVVPRSVDFSSLPRLAPGKGGAAIDRERDEIAPSEAEVEELKRSGYGVPAESLPHLTLDPTTELMFQALAPTAGTAFEGITQQGYIPSEPTVAGGPSQVFTAGNVSVTITDKDGSNRVEVNGQTFFGVPLAEGAISDAVTYYDALRGRFVALCFTQGTGPNFCYFYLAISKTSDARGAWWLYKFDQTLDGSTPTTNWSDYQELGISDDKLAMSSQQFSFGANTYMYQKIRVVDRALAYAGGPVGYVDFANFAAPPGGNVNDLFVTKVGRNLSFGDNTMHVFNVRTGSGSRVTYRTITGPPSAPVLSAGNLVTVAAYSAPPDAVQQGSAALVATNDCRTGAFYVREGVLVAAWHTSVNIGGGAAESGIRLFRMRTSDRLVLTDETFAAQNTFYYYPAVTVDSVGSVFLGFGRSSATEYPSSYATGKRRSDATIQPSALLKAGLSATAQSRWGDYTGIDMDASLSGPAGSSAWYAGQWTKTTNNFGTWISKLTFTYGVIAGTVFDDCDGNAGTTGDRAPLAGVTLTLKQGATTLGTASSDALGNYSFGYLETGTYDVVVTPPAGGAALDAIPGSGGTTQTRISALDLQVNLTNAQQSSGNTFLEQISHPAPVSSSINPALKNTGDPAFTLTIQGSAFARCAVVQVDGSSRATTFVNAGELTAAIPASDVTTAGTRAITVLNPAPGGGASNPQTLTVQFVNAPPAVTLGAPNGGEVWKAGTQHYVTWGASDDVGVTGLDLSYSTDGGATFPNVIATGVPNTGPYLWTVPTTPTTTARLRIVAHDGGGLTAADTSAANFTIEAWTILATAGAGGSVAPAGAVPVAQGGSQAFTVTPDPFHHITDVQVDGASIGVVTGYTFTNVVANHTIDAAFAVDAHTLTVSVIGSGSVAKAPDQPSYAHGTVVQLTATPAPGWSFVGWSGDTTTSSNPLDLPMTGNRAVTATFADSSSPAVQVIAPNGGETVQIGSSTNLQWSASDNLAVISVDLLLSRTGAGGARDTIVLGTSNSGSYLWTVTGPATADAFLEVLAHDGNGNTGADLSDAAFTILANVAVGEAPVSELQLAAVSPNPIHGRGRVAFALPTATHLRLSVVDVQGRELAVLAEGTLEAGRHQRTWDGRSAGGPVPPGLYFVRLTTAGGTLVRRVALVR